MIPMTKHLSDTAIVILVLISVYVESVSKRPEYTFNKSEPTQKTVWTESENSGVSSYTRVSDVFSFDDGKKQAVTFGVQKDDHTKTLENVSGIDHTTSMQFDRTELSEQRAMATFVTGGIQNDDHTKTLEHVSGTDHTTTSTSMQFDRTELSEQRAMTTFVTRGIQNDDHTKTLEHVYGTDHTKSIQFDRTKISEQRALVSTFPTTATFPAMESSVEECDGMVCETDSGDILVNIRACSQTNSPTINAFKPSTVIVMIQSDQEKNFMFDCSFTMITHLDHSISLTSQQLSSDFIGNFTLTISGKQDSISTVSVTDDKILKTTNVSFFSDASATLHLKGYTTWHTTQYVTLRVVTKLNMKNLPVVMLSNSSGYVTSPGYDGNDRYPNEYDGELVMNVADNESLLTSFTSFFVEGDTGDCRLDFLQFTLMSENKTWKECGKKSDVWLQVFRSTLHLHFHADKCKKKPGFRMMFAIVPRSQEPELLPSNLFNCSVPSFHIFKSIMSCNLLQECEGGEDEQDCGYRSNECGHNMLDAGNKCYRLVRFNDDINWFAAHHDCIQQGQELATFVTQKEFYDFQTLVPLRMTEPVFVGVQLVTRQQALPTRALYRNIWQWADGRTAFAVLIGKSESHPSCANFFPRQFLLRSVLCQEVKEEIAFVCEFYKQGVRPYMKTLAGISLAKNPSPARWNVQVIACKHTNEFTRDFLSCDSQADCGASYSEKWCGTGDVTVPMFVCQRSLSTVHFTLVCDHMQHCPDNSDEDFCTYPDCPPNYVTCHNGQCIPADQRCDGHLDCFDGSDEVCQIGAPSYENDMSGPLHIIHIDGKGSFNIQRINSSDECPQTHFLCLQDLCLPVYLRCNGVDDCPGREDEADCSSYTCPGFYRCRASTVCLHPENVCDRVSQCPQQDDELLCDLACPNECRCQGLAFVCSSSFSVRFYPDVRYLDASGSNMTISDVRNNTRLVGLRLSMCRISSLYLDTNLYNLRELDLSWNEITQIDMHQVHSLKNLRSLVLTGNPLVHITNSESSRAVQTLLNRVDLSYTDIEVFSSSAFSNSPGIALLNISFGNLRAIDHDGFKHLQQLQNIDLRSSPLINYPSNLLRDLAFLKVVYTDNYKLCCEAMLPVNFDPKNCHCTEDLLASCSDLLGSNVYRVFLWIFASLSIVGNVVSLWIRVRLHQEGESQGSFSVFVTNLSVADFLMGVYLAIIGTADLVFRGEYLWRDNEWKNSVACNIAGFLSLLSSEVSAFIICLITLDRFLVLRFPFSKVRFRIRSALIACVTGWILGIFLAAVPLLPATSHWEFYNQTGICIPLPFIQSEFFLGYEYSFSVTILLNLALFILIAVGQVVIYWAVRANTMPSSTKTRSRDAAIARRLITIVVSDFFCWFPIGLLGLLAYMGSRIPRELSVAVAIFVLPFNSALNPFLYTFNVIMEKRRKAHNEKLLKRLETRLQKSSTAASWKTTNCVDKAAVVQFVKARLSDKVLTPEDLLACSSSFTDKAAALRYVKFWLGGQLLTVEDLTSCSSSSSDKVTPE